MHKARLSIWARLLFTGTIVAVVELARSNCDFRKDFDITWGNGRARVLEDGQLLTLSLDDHSGSGVRSKQPFLFGKFQMQLKLVPGNSIGTISTFYLSSTGGFHDEVDLEFLGNRTGNNYILHTNVFTRGEGNREQQFKLWFDPTQDFHIYSILWNPQVIILSVDGIPIREFKNLQSKSIPYPKYQPMWVYASIWNSSGWATRFGHVKTNWSYAPFTASYRNFSVHSYCAWSIDSSSCLPTYANDDRLWLKQSLDAAGRQLLKLARSKFMIYDYCSDTKRFPRGFHPECTAST